MAQKTIPELQEITSPPIATTFLAADDGTQTFKLSLGELLRRPKNYRPTMTITPSAAAALTTFEHIIKLEVLMDENGLEWWMADINVQFSQAPATQTGFTMAFAGLLFEAFAEQPGVLAVTPSGGSPVVYTAGTTLHSIPNTNQLRAVHPSGGVQRYGVQGRFMLKEKPSFAADTEFLVLDGAGNPAGGGGLVNTPVSTTGTSVANTLEECDVTAAGITRTLPPLPLGGAGQQGITIVYIDAKRNASDAKDINIAPATGERFDVPGLVANDTLSINTPGGWIGFYAAPGDTSWKIQTQVNTLTPGAGTLPGIVDGSTILGPYIGQTYEHYQQAPVVVTSGATTLVFNQILPAGKWRIDAKCVGLNSGNNTLTDTSIEITVGGVQKDYTPNSIPATKAFPYQPVSAMCVVNLSEAMSSAARTLQVNVVVTAAAAYYRSLVVIAQRIG